jgi:hypothetical protein
VPDAVVLRHGRAALASPLLNRGDFGALTPGDQRQPKSAA